MLIAPVQFAIYLLLADHDLSFLLLCYTFPLAWWTKLLIQISVPWMSWTIGHSSTRKSFFVGRSSRLEVKKINRATSQFWIWSVSLDIPGIFTMMCIQYFIVELCEIWHCVFVLWLCEWVGRFRGKSFKFIDSYPFKFFGRYWLILTPGVVTHSKSFF